MAQDPQTDGGTTWEDNALVDAAKWHQKQRGSYGGPNVNSSTYLLKEEAILWDKDDYHILFKDRRAKDFKCEQQRSKLSGFGPWCEFQDIGRSQEHQCIFEERRKCIADYVDALQAFPPRGPWNNLNTQSEANTGRPYDAKRFPLDSIAATQSRAEWQKSGQPPLTEYPCVPYLVSQENTLCDRGKSGLVSIKAVQKALQKCMALIDKKCRCTNCDELPEEDDIYEFGDDDSEPDNPADDTTDDDGDPAPGVDRQTTTLSSHDMPIPITFGRISVKGNIIWVGNTSTETITYVEPMTPDTETAPEAVTKTVLTGALAIGLCKGTIEGISKITFGNRVVYRGALPEVVDPYDIETENSKAIYGELEGVVETAKRVTFKVYQGQDAERVNPRMVEVDGINRTPAYRGLAYLFIDNVPISEFANKGLPNITVEVYTRSRENQRPRIESTPLDGSLMTKIDAEFLALDVQRDRLYVSGGNTGSLEHGVRVFNYRDFREFKQQTPTASTPASMMLSRDNVVIYQETNIDKARTHWYSPEYDRDINVFGVNEPGDGHGDSPSSLAAWARPFRGPASMTAIGYTSQFDLGRPRTPMEYQLFPSLYDDLARFQQISTTFLVEELPGSRVLGYPDTEPSSCYSICYSDYNTSCVEYCTDVANIDNVGSGECVIEPANIWITRGRVYDSSTETVIGFLDRIDPDGSIYIIGNPVPVAVQDCSGVIPPGDPLPPDPLCIADCNLSAEAYCDAFCGTGTRIIEATFIGVRPTIAGDGSGDPETEYGALIAYRPYSAAPYSNMTSLQIEWLQIGTTETNLAVNNSFFPALYRTLSMELWGNNPSAILAQVISIPGGQEHVYFIKTLSGPDYAFRYNHVTDEVIWQTTLTTRLPAFYSANDRKVEYPNTDYMYVSHDGRIVVMELAEGTVEAREFISTFGLPPVTGAQLYDPRDMSITYIATDRLIKFFPTRPVIDDVSLAEIAAGVFELCEIGAQDYDVSALEDTRVVGYIIEDFGDAKTFLTQIRELFSLYVTDISPIYFGPPRETANMLSAFDARLSDMQEFAETRKWQDRQYTSVIVRSLNPSQYNAPVVATANVDDYESAYGGIKQFDTKFALYPGQGESLAELYLTNNQVTRGDLVITVGPEYSKLEPGDTFIFVDRNDDAREYVINTTNHATLPNTITASTIESLPPLALAAQQPVIRPVKPLRKGVLIFTNAVNDTDARVLIGGNHVVYAGIESPAEKFPATEVFAFGRSRETDVSASPLTRSSAIRFPAVSKPLHSGVAYGLPFARAWWVCDRTTVLTVTFDRASSIDIMSDATEIEVINDPTRNLLIYDGEQIQFLTVTRISDNVAEFRGLYRGRNGTEVVKDLVRDIDRGVRVYYYTPDTFVSTVVTTGTYAGRPWVETTIADTLVGSHWHVPSLTKAYDYGARLWAPDQVRGERLSTADYTDVRFEWKPRTPLTEREAAEFTPYLSQEKYYLYIWSGWLNGEIPIDDFDLAVYQERPGNQIIYRTPLIIGRRDVTIREVIWRSLAYNSKTRVIYVIVAQVHPTNGLVGLPGVGIVPN